MKEGWTTRWKALFIWLSGYLNIIAFALVGGYAIVKSEEEDLKKTAKQAFIVTLIFTLISMFFSIYSAIGGLTDNYYSSDAYNAYDIMVQIVNIAKIIVFVVFGALAFFKVKADPVQPVTDQKTEEISSDEEPKI